MKKEDAQKIITEVIQAHWPKWSFAGHETLVWLRALQPYDYALVAAAIDGVYANYDGMGHPKMPTIMRAVKDMAAQKHWRGVRTIPLYEILAPDGKLKWKPFFGPEDTPREEIERSAEKVRLRANELYGKGHIVSYLREPDETDDGYYGDEGCPINERRRQARDKAFADILDGPDTKTRRWLVKYLDAKHEKEDKNKPVHVREAIEI